MYLSSLVNRATHWPVSMTPAGDGDRRPLALRTIWFLAFGLLTAVIAGLSIGPSGTGFGTVLSYFTSMFTGAEIAARERIIIESIRLPRVIMGVLVGASLAVSGAIMQGLFRNPLADPGIVGVSAGAGLGAITVIVLGTGVLAPVILPLGIFAVPLAAFFGALFTTMLLYRLATRGGQTSISTLLLRRIAHAAIAGAARGILIYLADDAQLRDLTFWGLGSLAGATWQKCLAVAPIIVLAMATAPFLARGLNALALGEAAAHHAGIPVQIFKRISIIAVAGATGAAVAASGGIGFVGVVVPHLLRLFMGPDNRTLLPASALLGAALLLICDAISRTIVAPAELPIGVVTALIGAPFFLWILMSRRGLAGMG